MELKKRAIRLKELIKDSKFYNDKEFYGFPYRIYCNENIIRKCEKIIFNYFLPKTKDRYSISTFYEVEYSLHAIYHSKETIFLEILQHLETCTETLSQEFLCNWTKIDYVLKYLDECLHEDVYPFMTYLDFLRTAYKRYLLDIIIVILKEFDK